MQHNSQKREQTKEPVPEVAETIEPTEVVEEQPVIPEKAPDVTGVVVDCLKLNVRKAPNMKAEVASVIPALTEVVIDTGYSGEEFYKVSVAGGIEGFCMKKYIAVRR